MNSKQAKQIPLEEILLSLGYEPVKSNRDELLYHSPFRNEQVPSFFVNRSKNIFHDFGDGSGGNVLDFIMTYYDIFDVSSALRKLSEICGSPREMRPVVSKPLVSSESSESNSITILTVQSLQNNVLIQYLQQRGIRKQTAFPYLKEIYYSVKKKNKEKKYFALAFPNLSGGYEVRNRYFKGSIGKKDISLLAKRQKTVENNRTQPQAVTVFEGFIDFLSALSFYQVIQAKTYVIVLNSVSLKDRAIEQIRALGFGKVYLYLDRDDSGISLLAHFTQELSDDIALIDKSDLYTGYKDMNAFFVSTQKLPL